MNQSKKMPVGKKQKLINWISAYKHYFFIQAHHEITIKNLKVRINAYQMITMDGDIDGKRYRFSTKTSATLWALLWYSWRAKEVFIDHFYVHNTLSVLSDILFREYGKKIITDTSSQRNAFSQKDELSKLEKLCETFGDIPMHTIKSSDIVLWQKNLNLEPRTIINYRGTLSVIFKYAVYDELIKHNPLQVVKRPKIRHKEVKVFTQKEVEKLISSAEGQLKNIIQLTAFSGLRAGEMIALKWTDIDFRAKTLTVSRRMREGIIDVPKSKRIRVLDMLPQVREALKDQYRLTHDQEYIFITRFNAPYKRANKITTSIRRLCEKENISIGTLQTLRRTCNTMYKQYGLPNDWILDQLGHMQDEVNRKHYTGRLKPNLSKIGKVLSK